MTKPTRLIGISHELLKAATDGDANAQYTVGWHYENGRDVAINLCEAEKWWLKSAASGNTFAQRSLGILAYKRKDFAQAQEWWLKAAMAGNVTAQHNLGFHCSKKLGVEKSMEWIEKAADNGYWESQNFLGVTYFWDGVKKRDLVLALKWFTLGSEVHPSFNARLFRNFIKLFMTGTQINEASRLIQQWKSDRNKAISA